MTALSEHLLNSEIKIRQPRNLLYQRINYQHSNRVMSKLMRNYWTTLLDWNYLFRTATWVVASLSWWVPCSVKGSASTLVILYCLPLNGSHSGAFMNFDTPVSILCQRVRLQLFTYNYNIWNNHACLFCDWALRFVSSGCFASSLSWYWFCLPYIVGLIVWDISSNLIYTANFLKLD